MSRRKWLVLAAGISLLAVSCATAPYVDGVYEGQVNGMADVIKVEVHVERGRIVDVVLVEQHDTPGLFDTAFAEVRKAAIKNQTWEVDSVAGASMSSKGVMNAIRAALENAVKR